MASKTEKGGKVAAKNLGFFARALLFFRDPRLRFVIGIFLAFATFYLFLAFVSYLFTGIVDDSLIGNKTFSQLSAVEKKSIANWAGTVGAFVSNFFINDCFGLASFFFLYLSGDVSLRLMNVKFRTPLWRVFVSAACGLIWFSVSISFFFSGFYYKVFLNFGGEHGHTLSEWLKNTIGSLATFFIIVISFVVYCVFAYEGTIPFLQRMAANIADKYKALREKKDDDTKTNIESPDEGKRQDAVAQTVLPEIEIEEKPLPEESQEPNKPIDLNENPVEKESQKVDFEVDVPKGDDDNVDIENTEPETFPILLGPTNPNFEDDNYDASALGPYDPTKDLELYKFPTAELLNDYGGSDMEVNQEEQMNNKKRIIETLKNYGIEIKSIKATIGPTITLYEIVPQAGVRISKIKGLESEIMLSLAATGIRIIAPIPGKGTIGIEVPNENPQTVSMRGIINSKKFQESKYDLPVALGRTITNEVFMFDLCKMPHLLVAGATGQGKSVGLNALITSLLYKKHPSCLKFVLIDPKKVEFNIYARIEKHFLAKLSDGEDAIITDVTKVVETLKSLTTEMDARYDLLKKAHVRNIKEYNQKFTSRHLNPEKGHRFLPYIVVIVDEFGDLIMTAGKEVELPIARIAQLARAVGIHMVIATQRPSVNIITGVIKANFPARVAFRVSSAVDSKTILDGSGAQQLVGRGDLLFSQGSDLVRVQCAFVDTPEVERISNFIGAQQSYPTAFYLPEYVGDASSSDSSGASDVDLSKRDPLFNEAARLIVETQSGSTSNIQRKFSIGYNRAGRLMDQLEAAGIVGPVDGSKPRQVLMPDVYSLELKLNRM